MTKTYSKKFENKANAMRYYYSIRNKSNIEFSSCGYVINEKCYKVVYRVK